MHLCLFLFTITLCCVHFHPVPWLPTLAAVPSLFYLRLFSNVVRFSVHSLLCPTSQNVSAAMRTPHSASAICVPSCLPRLWWTESPSHWNVCHNKTISHWWGNAFERLCVRIRGRLGEHTGMSCVSSWHETEWLIVPENPFHPSLYCFCTLDWFIQARLGACLLLFRFIFHKMVPIIYFWLILLCSVSDYKWCSWFPFLLFAM